MVILKLRLQNEIRNLGAAPKELREVKEKASKYFDIENPCFSYIDQDRDKIILDSQEEYENILELALNSFTLDVEDSDFLTLARKSSLSGIFSTENRPALTLSRTESFLLPNRLAFSVTSSVLVETRCEKMESKETQTMLEFRDTETEVCQALMESCQNKETEVSTLVNLESIYLHVKDNILNMREEEKRIFMRAKCSTCKQNIFNSLFRCEKCEGFFNCKKCALENDHQHILIKSNFIYLKSENEVTKQSTRN